MGGLDSVQPLSFREEIRTQTHTQERQREKMAMHKKEGLRRNHPADTLILHFQPPEL